MRKLTQFFKENQTDIVLVLAVILVSLISFGVGRLTASQVTAPESIVIKTSSVEYVNSGGLDLVTGSLVASISGSKYHLPECSGAKRIKEENKIWFNSKEDAEKAGYAPAANCPGL